jgi:glycosyltransferase involved in cell wall biosynthesis
LASTGVPYYVFTHGMLDPWFKHRYPLKHLKKRLYWNWAEHRVLQDAAAVLFTCEEERRLARGSFSRYQVNEAVVGCGIREPTGVALEQREQFLRQFPQLHDKRLLLFLGRLHPKKGCEDLLEALAAVAPLDQRLHIAMVGPGDPTYVAALKRQAERLGIASRVCWAGMLRDDAKWGAFRAAEAFVLPSHQENFGISVAEALACGVPVLISNKVNIWREIAAEHAGLVEDDSVCGTTRLLQQWLDLPSAQRERLTSSAQVCFKKHFHIDTTTRRLLDILEPMTQTQAPCTPPQMSAA